MSVVPTDGVATTVAPSATGHEAEDFDGWDLDVSIVESGPEADRLIQMTDDGCGQTCQSACSTTCP
ncbi:FxLD family lanthipeptide [Streptomyces sp. NBC_01803]|uniref:FxLD family lanthipeptide n=1 Tax=Streptomyces sp. NBC_01803 TaxID=2975946 RepID=UPI002DDAEBF7|nr:FxLD family lanthipeptide [Streptomyces sp. NBC_01803]WSA46382.1 FxLD family lanthipeptide [Streptomyces sp. NBC_01803]